MSIHPCSSVTKTALRTSELRVQSRHFIILAGEAADPITVNLGGDGPLEHGHRDHHSGTAIFGPGDDPFDTLQGSVVNTHPLAYLEERPWYEGGFGGHQGLHGADFGLADRDGVGAGTHNPCDARRIQYSEPVREVESAEQITGKQGQFDLLHTVGPSPFHAVYRQKGFKASVG